MLRSVHEFSKTVNGRSWQVSVWEVRRAGHRREDLCSFLRMRSVEAHLYSHCHHRVHVLYYLWSHTGTAHCSSPTSYREFAPGKLIHGGEKTQLWRRKQRAANEDDYWRGRLDVGGTSLRLGGARADRNPREEMSPHRCSGASKPLQSGEAFQRFSNCTGATIKLDL